MKKVSSRIAACAMTAVLAGAVALAGCGSSSTSSSTTSTDQATSSEPTVTLQIFAANSLEKALPEVQALYTEQHPEVAFADSQFKASGDLVSTLKSGGTADVLITASTKTMDTAVANGSVDEATRADMFVNDLVICTAENSKVRITSIGDLATNPDITSIAIGDPNTVPAGKYAIQALKSAGLVTYDEDSDGKISNIVWAESIAAKMNAGADKVGTVASYVQSGQASAGFVYSSDIYRYDGIQSAFTTPSDSHKAIKYPGAVCTSSSNPEVAADFLDFCMTDPDAQKIFSQYGFELA